MLAGPDEHGAALPDNGFILIAYHIMIAYLLTIRTTEHVQAAAELPIEWPLMAISA